jgi:hypothetical protein
MSTLVPYRSLKGSIHPHPAADRKLRPSNGCPSSNMSGTILAQQDLGRPTALSAVADYQEPISVTVGISTGQCGRGSPDVAGNAGENSGYLRSSTFRNPAGRRHGVVSRIPISAVRSGFQLGLVQPAGDDIRDVLGTPGPANNSIRACER